MLIKKANRTKPRRSIWYGCDGIGKSSTVAQSESPVFIDCEDGLANIDADSTPVCKDLDDVHKAMRWLIEKDNGNHKTLVIDSIDWLERLIWKVVEAEAGDKPIEKIGGGYGKGYELAIPKWEYLLRGLNRLRNEHQMTIVLVAHAEITTFRPPNGESYQRYDLALHKTARALLREWVDEVFFLRQEQVTRPTDDGFDKVRQIAIEDLNERYIQTSETTGAVAKNRLGLPDKLPMKWEAYRDFWSGNGNIKGKVIDGSSKKEIEK